MTSAFGIWLVKIVESFEVKNIVSFNFKLQKQGSVKLTSRGLRSELHGTPGILRGSHQATKLSCVVPPHKRHTAAF